MAEDKQKTMKKTSIGGQALIEGIMMRGPERTAMAVRHVSGEIVLEEWDTAPGKRAKIWKLPFIRGIFNMVDSLRFGYKCLMRSAELAGLEDEVRNRRKRRKRLSHRLPESWRSRCPAARRNYPIRRPNPRRKRESRLHRRHRRPCRPPRKANRKSRGKRAKSC